MVNEGTTQILICAVMVKSSPDGVYSQPAAERKGTTQSLICAAVAIKSPDRVYDRPAAELVGMTQVSIAVALVEFVDNFFDEFYIV